MFHYLKCCKLLSYINVCFRKIAVIPMLQAYFFDKAGQIKKPSIRWLFYTYCRFYYFLSSSTSPALSISLLISRVASLNSRIPFPSPRANSGIFLAPKKTNTRRMMIIHSQPPGIPIKNIVFMLTNFVVKILKFNRHYKVNLLLIFYRFTNHCSGLRWSLPFQIWNQSSVTPSGLVTTSAISCPTVTLSPALT